MKRRSRPTAKNPLPWSFIGSPAWVVAAALLPWVPRIPCKSCHVQQHSGGVWERLSDRPTDLYLEVFDFPLGSFLTSILGFLSRILMDPSHRISPSVPPEGEETQAVSGSGGSGATNPILPRISSQPARQPACQPACHLRQSYREQ